MAAGQPRPRYRQDVKVRIGTLHAQGMAPKDIRQDFEDDADWIGPLPSLRTIEREVRKLVDDASGAWTLADSAPQDAGLVLDVLAEIRKKSKGHLTLTKAVGDWLVRVRRAVPNIPAHVALYVARAYQAAKDQGEPPQWIDDLLVTRAWEDKGRAEFNALHSTSGVLDAYTLTAIDLASEVALAVTVPYPHTDAPPPSGTSGANTGAQITPAREGGQ